jgi:transaldolase
VFWGEPADPNELAQATAFGAVGATCCPVAALAVVKAQGGRATRPYRKGYLFTPK